MSISVDDWGLVGWVVGGGLFELPSSLPLLFVYIETDHIILYTVSSEAGVAVVVVHITGMHTVVIAVVIVEFSFSFLYIQHIHWNRDKDLTKEQKKRRKTN